MELLLIVLVVLLLFGGGGYYGRGRGYWLAATPGREAVLGRSGARQSISDEKPVCHLLIDFRRPLAP